MDLAARLGALQERQFRLFFIGQSTSLLGDGMVAVALSFAILDLTGSVSDLGFVFADRLSRRAVMLGADVIRLGGQGLTAALLISGEARLWQLIVLASVNGGATAFFNPALTGLTPAIVSPGRLQQANVLRGISMAAGGIAGPAISGALVATIGSG